MVRNYCECYNTAGIIPGVTPGMSIQDRARLTIEAGYRAFRFDALDLPVNTTYNTRERITRHARAAPPSAKASAKTANGPSTSTSASISPDAIRGCDLIQDLAPFFVEDPVRTEAFLQDLPILRQKVNVPLAAGEEWGNRWDFNPLVENHAIDFCPRHPAQRRRHHRDAQDRGLLRNSLRRHGSPLHRPHRHRRAGQHAQHLLRPRW